MKLVIVDRDGTVNEDRDDFVKSPGEWQPIPGSLQAIARLNRAGWHVVVATNQSGLARGLLDAVTLGAIHQKMLAALAACGGRIDAIFFCPHGPDEGCDCRKPAPGLFRQIAARYGIELGDVPHVGDSLRDLQAGAAAGCGSSHLVLTGKSARLDDAEQAAIAGQVAGTRVHADLAAFAEHLLAAPTAP